MTHFTSVLVSARNWFSVRFFKVLVLGIMVLGIGEMRGQTNPTAQTLPYSQDFGTTTFTTMPLGMISWSGVSGAGVTTQALAEASSPSADASLTAATASQTGGGTYGYMTSTNGRVYVQTSSNASVGANQIALAIVTTSKSSITVAYGVEIINASPRTVGVVMQYRVGTSGSWTTVSGTGNPYSQAAGTTGVKANVSVILPAAAEDKAVVQLRWATWRGTESGNSSGVAIDNISVTGSAISCSDPTTQTSNVTFSNILSDQTTVSWTRGGSPGDGVIVVAKAGSAPDDPVDGTSYTANAAFGSGTQISTGTFVVFNGSGTSVNVTGFSPNTTYYYKVYEKNCTGTSIMINTVSPAAGNQATTAACAVNPTITTTVAVNTITPTTASSGGSTLSSGVNCSITAKGVCWNTSTAPTTLNSKTTDGAGTADFTSSLTSLSAQTLYYVRAYATNGFGTGYGPETTFRTLSTELAAHPVSFTSTAVSSSQINLSFSAATSITNADGYIILRRTGSNPTGTNIVDGIAPASLTMASGTTFVANINSTSTTTYSNIGLPNPNTQYNYAIIAYNWDGVNPETYNYYTVATIKTNTATTLFQEMSLPYTQDFEGTTSEWSLAASGTNLWAIGSATNNGGTKAMYISNNAGTANAYTIGTAQSGTDASVRVNLTGQTAASLTFDWKSNGEISSGTIYDYGEVYINTGSSDVLISSTKEFVNTTTFANRRISLTPYVGGIVTLKFRWVNDGSGGSQPPFAVDNISITAGDVAIASTTVASSITVNGASSGGNITNDGGSSVTARGVCYGTSTGPTITGSKTSDGSGTGVFTSTISGLTDNTLYYVRAYATNSTGTAYGNEVTFTTSSVSAPTSNSGSSISSTSFTANWGAVTGATSNRLDVSSTNFTSSTITETFTTIGGGTASGYNTRTWTGVGSITWTSFLTRTDQVVNLGNDAIALQDAANAYLISGAITGNPSNISFDVKQVFAGSGGNVILTVLSGVNFGTVNIIGTYNYSTTASNISATITGITGPYKIKIENGNTSARPCIDNLSFQKETFTAVDIFNDLPASGTSRIITGLSPATTYYYRVRAVGGNSTSVNSNVVSVTTLASYAIAASSSDVVKGSVTGAASYDAGASVSLTATPASGSYRFVNWTENGSFVSKESTYTFTASAARTLVANFADLTAPIAISTTTNASTYAACASCDVTVAAGGQLTIDEAKTFNSVTVAAGGKLTLANGVSLTAPITLQSSESGTATFVDSRTDETPSAINGTVEQRLPTGRNWYVGLPLDDATVPYTSLTAAGANSVSYWNESAGAWVHGYTGNLTAGVGYIAVSNSGSSSSNISFNGKLRSGALIVPVTRTVTASKAGFNLIANPYPSYLNAMTAINANAAVDKTIWYRTKGTSYQFETVNTTSGEGTNISNTGAVKGYVPPLQAFWVRVLPNASQPTQDVSTSLTFTNAMRYHANPTVALVTIPTTVLKAPSNNTGENPLLRLQVSKGVESDEAVIYFNANAATGYDAYDSPKWSNANPAIPELYTIASGETLSINGLPEIVHNVELPLGFYAGTESVYSIKAKELRNLEADVHVILKDGASEFDLTTGLPYEFNSTVTNTTNRFSLIFRTTGVSTSTNSTSLDSKTNVFVNANNEMVVNIGAPIKAGAMLTVYNALGQVITNQPIVSGSSIVRAAQTAGVYWTKITNDGMMVTRKVVLK